MHQVVEAARDLQGGGRRHHRQDDEHDGDGRLGRRGVKSERQHRHAEPADQAERHAAAPDADQDGAEHKGEFEEKGPHGGQAPIQLLRMPIGRSRARPLHSRRATGFPIRHARRDRHDGIRKPPH
jgi:hypothetical protein